jgi:hypothetical protein
MSTKKFIVNALLAILSMVAARTSRADQGFEVEVRSGFIAPVKLKDGRLFSVDRYLHAIYSSDGGRTWDIPGGLLVDQRGKVRHDSANTRAYNLCRLASGAIGLVYWERDTSKSTSMHGMRTYKSFFRKSPDESKTWSGPVRIAPANTPAFPTFLIQTRSGRLIVPSEYAFKQALHVHGDAHHKMAVCTIFYSDDEGQTWSESADSLFVREKNGAFMHFVEAPCVAETADGKLLMFMRTEMQRLAQSYSEDNGVHWSLTQLNSLVSSRSEALVLRIPSTGDLLCIWNQADMQEIQTGFYRSRLTSAISKDSGKTWQYFRTLVMSQGMKKLGRITNPAPPAWLRSSGAVPHPDLIPADGFRSVRAPRASIIDGKVYLVFDDRLYGRSPESKRGWKNIYYKQKLRVIPLSWFYKKGR